MTIQRGKDLLNQSNPSADELRRSITDLEQEKQYIINCVLLGFREKTAGDANVQEIYALIKELEEKCKSTN
jgi:hypothetical protein